MITALPTESYLNEIKIMKWIKCNGGMMVNAYTLDHDDPRHPYNQAKLQGVRPEDFGIENPLAVEFSDKNREDLIDEIMRLRELIQMGVVV